MEAAAIAWVAMLYKTPIIAIKSITNLLDHDNASEKEFIKNESYLHEHAKELFLIGKLLSYKTVLDIINNNVKFF